MQTLQLPVRTDPSGCVKNNNVFTDEFTSLSSDREGDTGWIFVKSGFKKSNFQVSILVIFFLLHTACKFNN